MKDFLTDLQDGIKTLTSKITNLEKQFTQHLIQPLASTDKVTREENIGAKEAPNKDAKIPEVHETHPISLDDTSASTEEFVPDITKDLN